MSPKIKLIFYFLLLLWQSDAATVEADDVKPPALLKSSVIFKANFYAGNEDEEVLPIARTEFYLFEQNPVTILKRSGFKPEIAGGETIIITEQDYLTATARAFSSADAESNLVSVLIKENVFKPNARRLITDQTGQFQTDELRPGRYYLFGTVENAGEIFVWNFSFEIKDGVNSIEIDQYNAEFVFLAEKIK